MKFKTSLTLYIMIVTVTEFTTCDTCEKNSHIVGFRVERDTDDSCGIGYPIFQDFRSMIPHGLVSSEHSDKDIVRIGLDLIKSEIDAFVSSIQSNPFARNTSPGVLGETFQYSGISQDTEKHHDVHDKKKKSIGNVLRFLETISTGTTNKDQRCKTIHEAVESGTVTPVNGSMSQLSYIDDMYRIIYRIGDTDTEEAPSVCMQARAADGKFIILVDMATHTVNIMVPTPIGATTRALESGLSPLETELIASIVNHIRRTVHPHPNVHVLYHSPEIICSTTKQVFSKAFGTFMQQTRNIITSRTGGGVRYLDRNVWYDVVDKYFTEMK